MRQPIKCTFCYRGCLLKEGESGICNVRINDGGRIRATSKQKIVAVHLDQIEKKPLYHFFPFEKTLSAGALGCNLRCSFCQNYQISQNPYIQDYSNAPYERYRPIPLLKRCNSSIMSYTYSEPIVWQDRVLEAAREVKEANCYNVMVTNGTFSPQSLKRLTPYIDAFNIDFKGDEAFYRDICKAPGAYRAVSDSIEFIAKQKGITLEVTLHVIEKYHTPELIDKLVTHLTNLGVQVLHLTRFFPAYKMKNVEATSVSYLYEALKIAKERKIPYVYLGNVSIEDGRFIECPKCHQLIERREISSLLSDEKDLYCPECHHRIYGRFS